MFKKRAPTAAHESRHDNRRAPEGVRAALDGRSVPVLDISSGGLRVAMASPPRVAVLTIYENGAKTLEAPAVLCWTRGKEAGYAFRRNLGLYQVAEAEPRQRHGSALRARLGL